jgi:hypothetical protein
MGAPGNVHVHVFEVRVAEMVVSGTAPVEGSCLSASVELIVLPMCAG